jgi:hypothetical protein
MKPVAIPFAALALTAALVVSTNWPLAADETPKSATLSVLDQVDRPATQSVGKEMPTFQRQPEQDSREVRVFPLHYVGEEVAAAMLKQLGFTGSFAPDPRTHSLIAHDSKENVAKLEALLKVIDRNDNDTDKFVPRPAGVPRGETTRRRNAFSRVGVPGNWVPAAHPPMNHDEPQKIQQLRSQYSLLNASALMKAEEYRQLQSSNPSPDNPQYATLQRLKVEVTDAVLSAYRIRQELQVAEIDWLRERLAKIEGQLKEREQLKQQIVDRRVAELLNPGLQWDSNLAATNEPTSTQTPPTASPTKDEDNRNNLKQLALAMHNYHDTYGHFPKAATTARDVGGNTDTPHSWRIDLLPFLGAADVFQQYKMDEPWDGPNNKKLLDRMPAVFRSPYDDPKSMSTAYAVLVGKGTIFEPRSKGIKISEIMDGTSNTLLVVEARRNCPWTKPEDIPFDADKPVPELGGFVEDKFGAAMADGHATIFSRSNVENILKPMITRNDGIPIQIPRDE